ncbi:PAS domain S-box protein [Desulfocurvus vexinensis]|uniref:PAS domain S-box protein n=1 Tax=Desulfocurvus vexinensis TaxID=399548 RepID=UPI00068783BE|nr:PAS domain S-box protein [Desulfocurvus vexinensis]
MRFPVIIFCALLAVLLGPWAARGQAPAPPGQGSPAPGADPGFVTAVVLKDFPPFFAAGQDGAPFGFAVDAMRAIAARAGLRVRFIVANDWTQAQQAVLDGRATLMAGLTPTPERLRSFIFTSPVFVSPACLMVRANNNTVKGPHDLAGRTLAALQGNIIPESLGRVPRLRIHGYPNPEKYIFDLLSGNADAVLGGRYELQRLTMRAGVDNLVDFVPGPEMEYKRALALAPDQGGLRDRLDAAVREFIASPQYPALVELWYGRPQPFWTAPRIAVAAGLALAAALLAALAVHYRLTLRLNNRLAAALEASRRGADELAHSRDLFRHLVENIRHVFWMRDLAAQRIVYVSPGYEALFGRSAQALYDDPAAFLETVHPDDATAVRQAMHALHETGAPFDMEFRILPAPGQERWVGVRAFRIPAADALPERVVGILEDITAHKKTRLATQESEALFRALFMDSSMVMLLVEPGTGRIVEANHAASAYYGWTRDELKARSVLDINTLPPQEVRAAMREAKAAGRRHFSFRHRLASGEVRDVEVYSGPVSMQGCEMLYSCIIDVTARREAEERLRRSEEFQQAIIACSPVALYSVDMGGNVLSWNSSAERIFGWGAGEVLGRPLPIVGSAQQEEFASLRQRVLAGETLLGMELVRNRKDGSKVHISLSTTSVLDRDGAPIGILGAAQDITARKQAEAELLHAKEAAEAASQAKSEFLANMSHEIRTPLNGLMGMLQLLETTALHDEQGEYVGLAKQSCTRLTRLLSDILDLSRVEAGKLSLQAKPFALADVVDQLKGIFRPMARQAGLRFECHIDPAVPALVVGDEVRLEQVLMNLLGNAFKFTTSGSVTLEAYRLPPRAPGQCRVLFSVADTGIGIPGEDIDKLFKPFSQVSEGFTRKYQGAGLGLVICKRLVELMGGNIAVDSEPGAGTTMFFCCTFQALDAPELAPGDDAPRPALALAGRRILVAEDDRVSALVAARLLAKAGAEATVVEDGQQALDTLRREPFDLALMDVQMPVLDGVEATRAIRDGAAGQAARAIPILAMTAYAMDGDAETFLAAGMDGYVSKPATLEDLTHAVEAALAGRG